MEILGLVLAIALGYVMGLLSKGVNININHNGQDLPIGEDGKPQYNESLVDMLPEDVRKYYETGR